MLAIAGGAGGFGHGCGVAASAVGLLSSRTPSAVKLGPLFFGLLASVLPLARDVEAVLLEIGRPTNQSEERPRRLSNSEK